MNRFTAPCIAAAVAMLASSACKKDEAPPAAEPPAAATPTTPTEPTAEPQDGIDEPEAEENSIVGEEVTYQAGDVELKGYLAYDKSVEGKRPGVLVVHEWWGHNDYARKRAEMLAALGYTALAVDMYGDGKQADHPDDAQKFMMEVMSNKEEGMKRFASAKALLEARDTVAPDKIAAIGYCFGGSVVLHAARTGMDLDGVAAFHPGNLEPMHKAKKGEVVANVMVAHGEADPFVKKESIPAFKKEMMRLGVDLEWHSYDGAKHAFTNPGATAKGKEFDLPLAYDQEADEKSWAALEKFLERAFES